MNASAAISNKTLPFMQAVPDMGAPRSDIDEINISLHEGHIPEFASRELDRLYGSIYSTVDQFSMDGRLESAETYIVRCNGEISVLLLFRVEGKRITVLNQMISLPAREIERFVSTVFGKYRQAELVSLKAIQTDLRDSHYLVQRHHCAEDIVAPLPDNPQEFLDRLSRNMREAVKRSMNKISRSFPSFRFEVYIGNEIEDEKAAEIYRFHKARMEETQRAFKLDDRQFADIIALARLRGMMTVAMIDGQVRGGLICWHVGGRYIMRIIAHDPALNEFKLGLVCCYLTMQECIKRGAQSFHFMAGRLSYKYRLLGVEQYFDQIVIYRSLTALLRNRETARKMTMNRALQDTKLWIMNAEKRRDPLSLSIAALISCWRRIKVFLRRPKKPLFRPPESGNTTYSGSA